MGRNSNHLGLRRKFEFSPFSLAESPTTFWLLSSILEFNQTQFLLLGFPVFVDNFNVWRIHFNDQIVLRVMLWSCPMIVGLNSTCALWGIIPSTSLAHTNVEISLGYHSTTIVNKQASISFLHHPEHYESCATKCYS